MNYNHETGLVEGVRLLPSPNWDERPAGSAVEVLVIHAISLPPDEFGGPAIEQLFCNCLDTTAHPYFEEIAGLEVSAHLLIHRDGSVTQFVPLTKRAWHAGVSCCEGRERVNDFSIGIELEGSDSQSFESAQYERLAELTRLLLENFPLLAPHRIYGHSDISRGRKTDPGPRFDWQLYRGMLA